jgi:peptidoglycan/xylan/chitin deacetylase (PgdA/CDA1 family)
MKRLVLIGLIFIQIPISFAQNKITTNQLLIKQLYQDSSYQKQKEQISALFVNVKPGRWGEFVPGAREELTTSHKIIAFTFDACGGKHGSGYDKELIDYLRQEKIPATLFITGRWIDANPAIFYQLSTDTLFEIENHGLNHRPCSICGESAYGIKGTANITEAFDEIESNERKIEQLTGRRPLFFRSATAFTDEACIKLAALLKINIVSYSILSGDAVPFTSASIISKNVVNNLKEGAIVIMHFNHPEWNTFEAMKLIIPLLKKKGYSFSKLESYPLKSK